MSTINYLFVSQRVSLVFHLVSSHNVKHIEVYLNRQKYLKFQLLDSNLLYKEELSISCTMFYDSVSCNQCSA